MVWDHAGGPPSVHEIGSPGQSRNRLSDARVCPLGTADRRHGQRQHAHGKPTARHSKAAWWQHARWVSGDSCSMARRSGKLTQKRARGKTSVAASALSREGAEGGLIGE